MRNVIAISLSAITLIAVAIPCTISAQTSFDKRLDSLFTIASSGEIKYQAMIKPADDSILAMGNTAIPRLVGKLSTKSRYERIAIERILKRFGPSAVPSLLAVLKYDTGLVIERSCYILGEIGDTSATVGILATTNNRRWQTREQSIGALGKIKDQRADSAVISAMNDSIPLVRKSAAVACGQLKIQSSIRPLVHMLGDRFYGARMPAAASLAQLDTPNVVQVLCDSMASETPLVGNLGCDVLGQIGTPAALDALTEQSYGGRPERRAHAAIALITADSTDSRNFRFFYLGYETDPTTRLKVESAIKAVSHVRVESQ
jgi:HEAT repeat protein